MRVHFVFGVKRTYHNSAFLYSGLLQDDSVPLLKELVNAIPSGGSNVLRPDARASRQPQRGDNPRIQCFEAIDLNLVDFALNVRRSPAHIASMILHNGEKMALPGPICAANEFCVRPAVIR
jgi:hypothetical protein